MEIREEKAKIWRKDIEGKNGVFHKYSVSVSKKNQDGKYVNAYIPVVFSKKADAPDKIENGALCDFEGFMSVESYTDRDGNVRNSPQIVIMSALFEEDGFEQAESEIPF
jgi:hypothetical protein